METFKKQNEFSNNMEVDYLSEDELREISIGIGVYDLDLKSFQKVPDVSGSSIDEAAQNYYNLISAVSPELAFFAIDYFSLKNGALLTGKPNDEDVYKKNIGDAITKDVGYQIESVGTYNRLVLQSRKIAQELKKM
jgi:hypothetical protein